MKVGILTFERFRGQTNLGSSKIRGKWVLDKWDEAEEFVQGKKYDVVIYQKAYMVAHAKVFKGIKIFDTCDPDFLHWGYQTIEMITECDAVTTSTEALAEQIRRYTDKPVVCIPDRINLDEFTEQKVHSGRAESALWYGYSHNFDMLKPVVPVVAKLNIALRVVSDRGFSAGAGYTNKIDLQNLPFSWKTIYNDIKDADMVVNPQSTKGKWKFKSNNKTLMAWALGLPVAKTFDDMKRFLSEEERIKEQELRNIELRDVWDIKHSVTQYKELIDSLSR